MPSFARTIRKEEVENYIEEILIRSYSYFPLPVNPTKASIGDYLYLVYRNKIQGRAEILEIDNHPGTMRIGSDHEIYEYRSKIKYEKWVIPNNEIKQSGFQGIRYLDTLGLDHLDKEDW